MHNESLIGEIFSMITVSRGLTLNKLCAAKASDEYSIKSMRIYIIEYTGVISVFNQSLIL